MKHETCDRTENCMRRKGHKGLCTANPSSATLDWDDKNAEPTEDEIHAATTLLALDLPTPEWADLLDES